MDKLLRTERSKAPRYLVGVLGWLKEDHFANVKRAIFERLKGRSLLLLAWVGPDIYHATKLEVIVACEGNIYTRRARAEPDKDKYWYARFVSGWQNATGHLRRRPPSPQTKGAKSTRRFDWLALVPVFRSTGPDYDGLVGRGAGRLKQLSPGRPPLAGFEVIMNGRI